MSLHATTEPVFFPGSGIWKQVPISRRTFGTPGIIDHYPEGPGETRPFEPPMSTIGQTGFGFGTGFALGTNPFGGGLMGNLAGQHPLWGGLGGLIGVGLGKIFNKK